MVYVGQILLKPGTFFLGPTKYESSDEVFITVRSIELPKNSTNLPTTNWYIQTSQAFLLTRKFINVVKNENFQCKFLDFFLIFAQNIDCGYTLEPPRRGGSNEYQQSLFWRKNKKNRYTLHTPVLLYKSGVEGGIHHTDMLP